jgi:DNA invertase Pin-like site-specific DNA recombinase
VKRSVAGDPRRAIAYLRVSTEDQRLGPEAQRAAIEVWSAREGVQIVAWHVDQGVSGAAPLEDRPALGAAVASLRPENVGVLVVAKRDRLARDVVVAGMVERVVQRAGARIVAADGAGNGDAPADEFMRTILDGAAAYERALIRSRTRAALKAKRVRGERAGNVPWGFTADAGGRLLPNDREVAAKGRATELVGQGVSLRKAGEVLAGEGYLGRSGKPLSHVQLLRMLRTQEASPVAS